MGISKLRTHQATIANVSSLRCVAESLHSIDAHPRFTTICADPVNGGSADYQSICSRGVHQPNNRNVCMQLVWDSLQA